MVAGGALLVGASAVGEVGTVGLATPVAAPGAALGVGLIASGSAMIINGTGKDLFNRYQHGRSISPADPQARADYLNLVGVAGGVGGMAARAAGAAGLATVMDRAAVGSFGALTADQGRQLSNDWGSLTPQQRTERVAQLGANAALLGMPAAGRAAPEGSFRSSGSGPKLKSPADAVPAEGVAPKVPTSSNGGTRSAPDSTSDVVPSQGKPAQEPGAVLRPGGGYTGDLIKVDKPDSHADQLAVRLGGESRVRFKDDPQGREFDAVSPQYIAQAKPSTEQINPRNRNQAKATFEAARQTGRSVYYHFQGGAPRPEFARKLQEYSERYNIRLTIDDKPLQ
jgi:hypothetical protein